MTTGPTNVPKRILNVMTKPMIHHRTDEFHKLYDDIQEKLKYLYKTGNDIYISTSSGTGGVEILASNFANKRVLVIDNGEYSHRMYEAFLIYGAKAVKLSEEWGKPIEKDVVDDYLKKYNDEIDIVAMVHNETSTGVRNPLEGIAEVAKKYGKLIFTDSTSSIGGDYVETDKWDLDMVVGRTQKCLACPPGLAFVSVSNKVWKYITKEGIRTFYFDINKFRDFHKKSEVPFTPPISLLYALDEGLDMLKEEGLENRIKRHLECSQHLRRCIKKMKMDLVVKNDYYASRTATAIYINESAKLRSILKEKYNIVISGSPGKFKGKVIRIATMGSITKNKVDRTLDALEKSLQELNEIKV